MQQRTIVGEGHRSLGSSASRLMRLFHRSEITMSNHVADGQRARSASFALPPDLLDALRVEAGRRDVSVSALVRRVLAQALAEWERERRAPPPEDAKDP